MIRLLLVEDEEIILRQLHKVLSRNGYRVSTARDVPEALAQHPQSFDLLISDLRLPGTDGTELISAADPTPVVIMTSHASVRSAVTAMQAGAIDYIAKPFDHDELLLLIERALQQNRMLAQNRALMHDAERLLPASALLASPSIRETLQQGLKALESEHFLALHGERGCGREWMARLLHEQGQRKQAPLVVADLPSASPDHWPTLLFGANADTLADPEFRSTLPNGVLRGAHGGTLVLRYADTLPPSLQSELAALLKQQGYDRRGHVHRVDLNTILLSELPVAQLRESGRLEPELAELFEQVDHPLVPLRERQSDIPALAEALLERHAYRYRRQVLPLDDAAIAALRAYAWPGNIVELEAAMLRAVMLCRGRSITPADLGIAIAGAQTPSSTALQDKPDAPLDGRAHRDLTLDEYFRYYVLAHQGELNETELAKRLGISRKALWERRQKMGLSRD